MVAVADTNIVHICPEPVFNTYVLVHRFSYLAEGWKAA
jgi:hypothetical protein